MGTLHLKYKSQSTPDANPILETTEFEKFNSGQLGLGDISKDGEYFEAIAAIFDLEGFTIFCNQIDPHLVIPEYLNEFLNWLFQELASEFTSENGKDEVELWSELPFYAKFLGDGVLFLWDSRGADPIMLGNVILSLRAVCRKYVSDFLPAAKKRVTKPPPKLRCGIARGQIISIGSGDDFVGPCINVAARLQKLGLFSFAFSKRGFNIEKSFGNREQAVFQLISFPIRGIGETELVYVLANEFKKLQPKERSTLTP